MRLLKLILISSVLLMLAAAPAQAGHAYNHPKPPDVVKPDVVKPDVKPDVVKPDVVKPDVVKGRVVTRVPPNAPKGPGRTTLGNVTEVPPGGILGSISGAPETEAGVLPFTGAELTGITLVGLTMIGAGMIVLARVRRRS